VETDTRDVLGEFFESKYMPCEECGASVARAEREAHKCERERWLSYQVFQRRDELERFDHELAAFLESPRGRFEAWYAARSRSAPGG
jgi:hypothetical protein